MIISHLAPAQLASRIATEETFEMYEFRSLTLFNKTEQSWQVRPISMTPILKMKTEMQIFIKVWIAHVDTM